MPVNPIIIPQPPCSREPDWTSRLVSGGKHTYLLNMLAHVYFSATFALWGTKEKIFDESGALRLKEIMNDKVRIQMIDTGHMPQIERPQEAAGYYQSFLN